MIGSPTFSLHATGIAITLQNMGSDTIIANGTGRRRRLGTIAIGVLLSLIAVEVGAAGSTSAANGANRDVEFAPAPAATTQQNVFLLVNSHRRAAGRRDVRYNASLTSACQRHAQDMARRNVMSHTGSDGTNGGQRITRAGFRWTSWGENLAVGQTSSQAVVSAWMNSSGHRANLLNWRFQWMGVGIAWGHGRIWWCVVLASG